MNIDQHELFLPKVEELEQYLKDVQEGKAKYDGKYIVDTVESFGDVMVEHLTAVGYPIGLVVTVPHCLTTGVGHVGCRPHARQFY